jgi:6-phosphogluconolactonase
LTQGGEDVVGHLYMNDNTAGMNTIGAFDRHADGTLTPMPGSPFATGGVGIGKDAIPSGPAASQGALRLSGDGRYLLAFAVSGGSLTELPSSPTPAPAAAVPVGIVVT